MKRITILILAFVLTLASCMPAPPDLKLLQVKDITVKVRISDVRVYKYSRVSGYFTHGDFRYYITNGNNGYYYKKYSLKPGDEITTNIRMSWYEGKVGTIIVYTDLELEQYEIN